MNSPSINTIILKVAAPCNLNCSYCYEYNRGDESWKTKPGSIAPERCELLGQRIREYCFSIGAKEFGINLHGGEPMLLGPRRIGEAIDIIRAAAAPVTVRFGMQSNGTLTSPEMVEILSAKGVNVGVSLDGDEFSNRHRVDHKGRQTREATVRGARLLNDAGVLAGLQAVVDLDSDPVSVLDALVEIRPGMLELTIPFGNHDNPPEAAANGTTLGRWMCDAFDHWVTTPALGALRIRFLQDALEMVLSENSRSDWFPGAPPGYLVVATDGAYEGLDTLKVGGENGRVLNMNITDASISEAAAHPLIQMRSTSDQLCAECASCPIVKWCNGGYFPTRFGRGNGFFNPSVYCEDFKLLFAHIAEWVLSQKNLPDADAERIANRLRNLRNQGALQRQDTIPAA